MSRLFFASLAVLAVSAVPAAADDFKGLNIPGEFSANVALTSEYVFRGISQSNEEPTVQGGFDWAHPDTGLYLGAWGSGVDFADATTEIDFYGGVSGTVDKMNWDVGAIYYAYPGADDALNYDFWELSAALGYDFDIVQTSLSVNYSPDYFASSGDSWYPALYITAPLPEGFTFNGHVARQWVDDNAAFGVEDYTDWAAGLSYNIEGFDLSITYYDTSLDEPDECADGCAARGVFAISRSF